MQECSKHAFCSLPPRITEPSVSLRGAYHHSPRSLRKRIKKVVLSEPSNKEKEGITLFFRSETSDSGLSHTILRFLFLGWQWHASTESLVILYRISRDTCTIIHTSAANANPKTNFFYSTRHHCISSIQKQITSYHSRDYPTRHDEC